LACIERDLRAVQKAFPEINGRLQMPRDEMSDRVVEHMLAGYAYVDRLLAERTDMLAMGRLSLMAELNHIVLCGTDPVERARAHQHMEATEQAFYDDRRGGVRDIMEWYERNRDATVWRRAAGVYVRMLSEPQLFLEGNHRTGALAMSYLLAREGAAPFVLTVDNAEAYFTPSALIRLTRKTSLLSLWRMPRIIGSFAAYLERVCDPSLLVEARATEPRVAYGAG
jgi:hypothetical protein